MQGATLTICTDFGTRDGYVGAMKGVIRSICPAAGIVDITHAIAPGDIAEAAFVLETFHSWFPPGTVHLVVVDPGVGSDRRALVVESAGQYYVGPDNGVFEPVYCTAESFRCREITSPRHRLAEVSSTFHGRDIFAPAAAWLSAGIPAGELGPEINDPVRLAAPSRSRTSDGGLVGQVIHVDRFGNLVTDIRTAEVLELAGQDGRIKVSLLGRVIRGLVAHYAAARPGELIALLGSHGRLEVAANGASAAETLGEPVRGAAVHVAKE